MGSRRRRSLSFRSGSGYQEFILGLAEGVIAVMMMLEACGLEMALLVFASELPRETQVTPSSLGVRR